MLARRHAYFAYGSNLCVRQMARRCPDARDPRPAVLGDHDWLINERGVATVEPFAGNDVHGVLWQLSDHDLTTLDSAEGVPVRYRRDRLTVHTDGGPSPAGKVSLEIGRPEAVPSCPRERGKEQNRHHDPCSFHRPLLPGGRALAQLLLVPVGPQFLLPLVGGNLVSLSFFPAGHSAYSFRLFFVRDMSCVTAIHYACFRLHGQVLPWQ